MSARVRVCANCRTPIIRVIAGPRAGIWVHAEGSEGCLDPWGQPWPNMVATPAREPGTPTGPAGGAS